jgi:cysteinyl-tRNA synthetase
MSWKHLGEVFDIHGGGIDLLFPHHENEMAQSCSAFGHDVMANYWMHNGHLQVEGEKMAKSLGNFVTIRELLHADKFGGRSWPGEVLRLAILKTHYRQPIDFTVKALEEAEETCGEWFKYTYGVDGEGEVPESVIQPLLDDLNISVSLAGIHEIHAKARANDFGAASQLKASLELLGIRLQPHHFERRLLELPVGRGMTVGHLSSAPYNRQSTASVDTSGNPPLTIRERIESDYLQERGLNASELNDLISARSAARAAKNWAEADRIRDELDKLGITLQDDPDGTTTPHYHHVSETGHYELKGSDATLKVKK